MTIIPFLSVKDVDAAITFYTEKLGFTKDMAMDGPDGKTTFGFVRLGDSSIGLNRAETENAGMA